MFETKDDFRDLLLRILLLNALFVLALTAVSFIFFISYASDIWRGLPKFDIFKVFFMNFRFNLSAVAYANIPICVILLIFPALKADSISKFFVIVIKLYYSLALMALFMLHIYGLIREYLTSNVDIANSDFMAHFASVFMMFDSKTIMVLMGSLFFLTVCAVIFFSLFITSLVASKEYSITDRKQSLISLIIALFLCAVFARGKILRNLSMEDSCVTPSITLNGYAAGGAYKILRDFRNFNPKNIRDLDLENTAGTAEIGFPSENGNMDGKFFRVNDIKDVDMKSLGEEVKKMQKKLKQEK